MKKENVKRILPYVIMIVIGVLSVILLCERAEQMNKKEKQREKVNNAIYEIMH